jgi:uncharacterized protein (TIGR02147 family)
MNIFDFEDYREFLKTYLSRQSVVRKHLLSATGISSSFLTQVLSGTKQLSSDQGYEIALYAGLTERETDYFLLLIDLGKAGSHKLQQRINGKIKQLQSDALNVSAKVSSNIQLTEEQKAIYYSNWIYSAVRNLIPTQPNLTTSDIAKKLNVPEVRAESAIQLLLDFGLINKTENGLRYQQGYTHLSSSHPLIFRHHQNWRQRAIQRMDHYNESHLHYTCPMAISRESVNQLRLHLLESIKNVNQSLQADPDVSFCLNIDLFEY